MINRFVLGAAGVVAAVAGPAALYSVNDHVRGNTTATAQVAGQPDSPSVLTSVPLPPPPASPAPIFSLAALAPAGANNEPLRVPTVSMVEAFNMNVTPEWIANRWPRVSDGLAQINLQGYRVPLITGTTVLDVAGSLTYYFNPLQKIERITFQGTTGDPRNLIGLLAQRYRFSRRLTNDPGLIVYETPKTSDQPQGWLQIRPAAILQASDPYHRFEVELLLERPED